MPRRTLLDGATLHAAGALFQRVGAQMAIRPINILSLSALIDAYVLFDRLAVPKVNWQYFTAVAPADWVAYLQDVVEPVDIAFDLNGFREFIANPYVFIALNSIIHADNEAMIHLDYRTYVGGDMGIGIESGNRDAGDEILEMEEIVKQVWSSSDENWNWNYFSSNAEHVDPIHAVWRGCQYSEFCARNECWYVPHELRGRFLDFHATMLGRQHQDPMVERIMTAIRERFLERKNNLSAADAIPPGLFPQRPESELLWQQFKMPLVSARVFQRSDTLYHIFERASALRQAAAPFRKLCAEIDLKEKSDRLDQAEAAYAQVAELFRNLDQSIEAPGVNWSVSLSYPWGVSVGLEPRRIGQPKHLSFARDIYSCRMLPATYKTDLIRIFGEDPSDFLRRYERS